MSKVCSYTAVPTDIVASKEVAVEKEEQRSRLFKCLRVVGIFLFVWAICGAIFDDDHHHHGHHAMKHSLRHHHQDKFPTKLPGGGRDWLVNAVNGTIHAKHNPALVLGVDTTFSLVLVQRESPNQLNFGPPPKNQETFLPFQDTLHHFGVEVGDKQHVGDYHVRSTKLSRTSSDALVSYQEDNFIVLENSKSSCQKHKMVLDVQDWNLREFQPVNFVEGPHWDSFASTGGGRDFVWETNGSISLKLNPDLVLGRAAPSLILVHQDSEHKIVLQHARELANGKAVELTLVGGGAIGQRYTETREYGPWRYIESQVVDNDEKDAIVATYDGNFILANNNGLALDVSFWDLEQGTPVNFVGGNDVVEQQSEQTQSSLPKSALRGSHTGSSSSDTSTSSSDSSLSSSESSNTNMVVGQDNISENEVYEDEDFVLEDEAFDHAQEELDLAIVEKDLPSTAEEIRVVNRLNGD